jgi:hypothetical protein
LSIGAFPPGIDRAGGRAAAHLRIVGVSTPKVARLRVGQQAITADADAFERVVTEFTTHGVIGVACARVDPRRPAGNATGTRGARFGAVACKVIARAGGTGWNVIDTARSTSITDSELAFVRGGRTITSAEALYADSGRNVTAVTTGTITVSEAVDAAITAFVAELTGARARVTVGLTDTSRTSFCAVTKGVVAAASVALQVRRLTELSFTSVPLTDWSFAEERSAIRGDATFHRDAIS